VIDMTSLCDDLAAENAVLDALVAGLDEAGWDQSTPAEGWSVRDHIAHLAYSDVAAYLAAVDSEAFARDVAAVPRGERQQRQRVIGRAMSGAHLLHSWRLSRAATVDALRRLEPRTRLPWFGPPMSAASSATARLQEAWAHGQDVADTLGVARDATERLRHVAHLGVITRAFSFTNQGQPAPAEDVRVELRSPAGTSWIWGDPRAADRVTGPALDFCLVVTRRRHPADTRLEVSGSVAEAWMLRAQAFAGPPGEGRRPGQFPRPE
jgi:uncharacterized protein (TIGR03084 family)